MFLSFALQLFRHLLRHPSKGGEEYEIGKALLATLVGILLIIATASSINAIPVVYWCVLGLCAAYLRLVALPRPATAAPSPARPNALRQPSF